MEKCSCWKEKEVFVGNHGTYQINKIIQYCNGTKEQEECSCNGDKTKCNFYPEIREKAQLKLQNKKFLNTIEMIQLAEKDGKTYKCLSNPIMFYNKKNKMFLSIKDYSKEPFFIKFDDLNYFLNYKWEQDENIKIIIINGSGGVGKSTFISYCKEINNDVIELSTVDFVKEVAEKAGWNGKKDEKGRRFLSDLKKIMSDYDNIPNKKTELKIEKNKDKIIFLNVREPENIEYYKKKYNALTLLIENPNIPQINSNNSDLNVNNFKYDVIIENNKDKELLKQLAKDFMLKYF